MFQEEFGAPPSAAAENAPKVPWQMNKDRDQIPDEGNQTWMRANPHVILNYNLNNYNKGGGYIKQSTIPPPVHYLQPVRPTWAGLPPSHLSVIQQQKDYLKNANQAMDPEYTADKKMKGNWGKSVYVLVGGVLALVAYVLYAF